ncbi:MAG: low molecular weight protein-tyrosine-phosphatase [Verrucomicrobiota bacterium]
MSKFRVLFVCMGNICRSPAAEGVFTSLVAEEELEDRIEIDSAGTISFHEGNPADPRMSAAAADRGYKLTSRARQIKQKDLSAFDLVITMDDDNYDNVLALSEDKQEREKVKSFCDYCKEHSDQTVPDPYYGGADGFEHVLDLLEDGCSNLLMDIKKQLS